MWNPRSASLIVLALGVTGCAVNPATGQRQLMLVSESQEIQMGQQSDPAVVAQYGLYPDEGLQTYIAGLGARLAARSERPELPWTFRLVDDPVINAFALPGGFIYVTRGILAYFNSEAELASVMGHEIGHVTARHSAHQMSQQQIAQVGLIAGVVFLPEDWSNLALGVGGAGLQLLFLKFSRDDESQADDLGMRYLVRADYDAREMPGVYAMLARVSSAGSSGSAGAARMPEWLSTHPDPLNREQRMLQHLDTLGQNGTVVNRDAYLRRLDGLVYGVNPREGFFRETAFLHPDLRFRLDFPTGWKTANYKAGVVAASQEDDARMQLTLAEGASADAAARTFAAQEGLQAGPARPATVHGLRTVSLNFTAATEQTQLRGLATFIEYGGNVYELIGYTAEANWARYQGTFVAAHGSFAELTDQAALRVQPLRLSIVTLDAAMTLQRFHQRYPSQVPVDDVARLNGVEAGATLPRGTLVKRVVGGPLP
jgi:predicted Zn-dependent protease